MDKNFSDILNIFKKLEESSNASVEELKQRIKQLSHEYANTDDFVTARHEIKAKLDKAQADLNALLKNQGVDEDKTSPTGPKFGGYWGGKDKGTPEAGEGVGSMEEAYGKKPRKGSLAWQIQQQERQDYLKGYAKDPHGKLEPGDSIAGPSGTSTFKGKEENLEEELMSDWKQFQGEKISESWEVTLTMSDGTQKRAKVDAARKKAKQIAIDHFTKKGFEVASAKVTAEIMLGSDYGVLKDPTKRKVKEGGTITAQGATSVTAAGNNAPKTPSEVAADANAIKQGLSGKLPSGVDVTKLSNALAGSESGKPMNNQQQAAGAGTLSKPIANIAKDPAMAQQLGNLIKKAGGQQ
ncbi:MAG TPA: hypothetical protein VFM18_18590 [Methanosarcina sp.]|nr:hypothetical protein [Methanosarcina sp.]